MGFGALGGLLKNYEAFSKTQRDPYTGEGGAYIIKHADRNLKSYLPPGLPTIHSWTKRQYLNSWNSTEAIFNLVLNTLMFTVSCIGRDVAYPGFFLC